MYIITDNTDKIIGISTTVSYEDNGNVIKDDGTGISATIVKSVFDVAEIPEGVEVEKYCYTEADGFTKNPNYVAPGEPLEDQITDLQEAVAELAELIVGGNE